MAERNFERKGAGLIILGQGKRTYLLRKIWAVSPGCRPYRRSSSKFDIVSTALGDECLRFLESCDHHFETVRTGSDVSQYRCIDNLHS